MGQQSFRKSALSPILAMACVVTPLALHAQSTTKSAHPRVCTEGVKVFHSRAEAPAPFDTLVMPESDKPIRVTNEEEAAAAELMIRERAGSVGATGLLVAETQEESGDGMVRMHRSVTPVFAASDTARAYKACRK